MFFEPLPLPDDSEPPEFTPPAWFAPPAMIRPGRVLVEAVVARTESVVVEFARVDAYPTGLVLLLEVSARRPESVSIRSWQMSHGPFQGAWGGDPRDGIARWGVALGDGSRAVVPGPMRGPIDGDTAPEGPQLHLTSGGGGGGSHSVRQAGVALWLWPLPSPADFEFVMEWPALDIPESRITLDGAALVAAASRAEPLWPNV